MIGCHDHLVPRRAPLRDEGRQHLVHDETGVVHLLAVVEEPVAHAVQRAGMQHPVVQPEAQAHVGQRGKEVDVRGRHLVVAPVARHRVKAPVVDGGAVRLVIFHVAHVVEGVAVEELRPEAVRHRAGDPAALAHLGKDILVPQSEDIAVAGATMRRRGDTGVDRGIAGGGDRGQHRPQFPDPRIAAVDPAFEIAEQAAEIAVGHAVQNDQQEFVLHGGLRVSFGSFWRSGTGGAIAFRNAQKTAWSPRRTSASSLASAR